MLSARCFALNAKKSRPDKLHRYESRDNSLLFLPRHCLGNPREKLIKNRTNSQTFIEHTTALIYYFGPGELPAEHRLRHQAE